MMTSAKTCCRFATGSSLVRTRRTASCKLAARLWTTALAGGLILSSQILHAQDHGHLNVGAPSTSQNAKLIWDNGADFIASIGYVKTLDYTNGGKYSNYFQGNITPTALPATSAFGGPTPNAPALGSLIVGRMSLLEGPDGGRFGFWETNSATAPAISLAVGEMVTNLFRITQTDGSPGTDPFGHIHGRRLSATKPGLYKVGFQAFDVSTSGAGGGPIHTPSDVLPVWFQAGVTIASIAKTNNIARITYGSVTNRTGVVEYSTNLAQTNWSALRTNAGTDYFQTVIDTNAVGGQRFYRVRVNPLLP